MFRKLCLDDANSLKWCKLNIKSFKNMFIERYGKTIGERMVTFIESNYGSSLHKIDFLQFM